MTPSLSLPEVIQHCSTAWQALPDHRRPNNNTQYTIRDAALSAFSVFFMQAPSFLAHQRDMHQRKGRSNAHTLFQIDRIPSDNQIRNLLDPLAPHHFEADFEWVWDELQRAGKLDSFRDYGETFLIPLDGVTYFTSQKISCPHCSQRLDRSGLPHYFHSAITPVVVKPDSPYVLPLPPEFITPQDGHEKQDCERAAAKRWLHQHHARFLPYSVTYLGDDLYANHPLCDLIHHTDHQYFLFVCKPESHPTLYQEVVRRQAAGEIACQQERHWNGRSRELWRYRWASALPLRAGDDEISVCVCLIPSRVVR